MMPKENTCDIKTALADIEFPLLIVSSVVGKGIYSIGEAVAEQLAGKGRIHHIPIEEMVGKNILNEDLHRYKFISNRLKPLLYLIYKLDIFYYRKYIREKIFNNAKLEIIEDIIRKRGIKTVLCATHRPAFWVSSLKRKTGANFKLWGLLSEYGRSLGWKYIFWNYVDGYLSPIGKDNFDFDFSSGCKHITVTLPARSLFYELAGRKGDIDKVLLVSGFWGQGPVFKILKRLLKGISGLKVYVVCGDNKNLLRCLTRYFKHNPNIIISGKVDNLSGIMAECASIITKPGISTLLEARAAARKIFLLKGMPVAEDHNAQFAIKEFSAEWFSVDKFKSWYDSQHKG